MSNHDDSLAGFLRKRHSVSKLVVHLIFTTKYRRKLFDGQMIAQLRELLAPLRQSLNAKLLRWTGSQTITLTAKTGGQCDGQQSEISIVAPAAPAKHTFTNAE